MYILIHKNSQKAHIFASYSQIAKHLKKHVNTVQSYFNQAVNNRYENKQIVLYKAETATTKANPRGDGGNFGK